MKTGANSPAGGVPAFSALRHPGFRAYVITSALAMMADNIEHVITYWVMFEHFRSPVLGGVAVLTHWLPFLLLSVYFGGIADRFDKRRVIQVAMLLFMGVSLGWALLFLAGVLETWHAVVLLTVHGLAGVLWAPASQILIHDIVGQESLQSAVRLSATSRYLGILMGPAVGGALMLVLGAGAGLLLNVLIYLPLVWWLWRTPYGTGRKPAQSALARGGRFEDTWATLREAARNPTILSMMLLGGISSFFIGNAFQAQMPEYAHDLGTDEADFRYSMLLAANAAGAFTGGLILEARGLLQPKPGLAVFFGLLWSLVICGFAAATNYPLALGLMFAAGFLNLSFSAMAQTLVQIEAPEHLRGRIVGLFNMSINGLRAFSGVTVGMLGGIIGIHWSLGLSAIALFAFTLWLQGAAMRLR